MHFPYLIHICWIVLLLSITKLFKIAGFCFFVIFSDLKHIVAGAVNFALTCQIVLFIIIFIVHNRFSLISKCYGYQINFDSDFSKIYRYFFTLSFHILSYSISFTYYPLSYSNRTLPFKQNIVVVVDVVPVCKAGMCWGGPGRGGGSSIPTGKIN